MVASQPSIMTVKLNTWEIKTIEFVSDKKKVWSFFWNMKFILFLKNIYIIGYCCVIFMQCSATSFRLNNAGIAAYTQAMQGSDCSEDYIGIEGTY